MDNLRDGLVKLTASNQVVIVADMDHGDPVIPETMRRQLGGMYEQGVRHLFLELDPKEHSLTEIMNHQSAFGGMVKEARQLGIEVHLYDDRSDGHALAEKYPEATKYREEHDNYVRDPEALIEGYKNQDEMRAYLSEYREMVRESIAGRNSIMIENIDAALKENPGERALVKMGAAHLWETNDVDEGLRMRGHQVATVEISSPNTSPISKEKRNFSEDKPDVIVSGPEGVAISYKEPHTNTMKRAMEGIDLPWKNTQQIEEICKSELSGMSAPSLGCHPEEPGTYLGPR